MKFIIPIDAPKSRIAFTLLWLVVTVLWASIFFPGCSKRIEGNNVPSQNDWSNGFLRAKGYGRVDPNSGVFESRFNALQEAKHDALVQLRRLVYALPIDSQKRVEDLVHSKKKIREEIDRFISGAKVINTRLDKDREIEVEMELYLGVSLKSALGLLEKPQKRKGPSSNSDSTRF